MKKRSLVAIGMAGIMTVAMSMPVLAFNGNGTETADTTVGEVDVELKEPVAYTVTLPAKIDLKAADVSFTPTVAGKLGENKKVSISLKELNNTGELAVVTTGSRTAKVIFKNGETGITDKIIAKFGNTPDELGIAPDSTFTAPTVSVPTSANLPAGEYTASVTYLVSYN